MSDKKTTRIACGHGQLKRSCNICELEERLIIKNKQFIFFCIVFSFAAMLILFTALVYVSTHYHEDPMAAERN